MECTWNTSCPMSETCLVRNFPGYKFTTHCIMVIYRNIQNDDKFCFKNFLKFKFVSFKLIKWYFFWSSMNLDSERRLWNHEKAAKITRTDLLLWWWILPTGYSWWLICIHVLIVGLNRTRKFSIHLYFRVITFKNKIRMKYHTETLESLLTVIS